ncbi:hypothetical protein FXO38_23986 [Capsicum annuum]|nr:hypothetical protein FXO38_23986 [Capsicum annuum]
MDLRKSPHGHSKKVHPKKSGRDSSRDLSVPVLIRTIRRLTKKKFVFEELLERAREKEEKEAKKRKRLADEFYELIHASKEITALSKWEDCKSLFGDRQVTSFAFIDLELVTRLQGPLENDN